jgi:hypothetical protein
MSYVYEADQKVFEELQSEMNLTISFAEFLTMIIKYFDQVINDGRFDDARIRAIMDGQLDEEIPATLFRLFMVMETDGSATLRFIKSI